MSSSETEEFFDALDVTPLKDKEQNKAQHGGFDEGGLGDIDEEKTLLETKKLVEISRKLEDAALEKRLHLIQAGKEKERQENLQHETLEKNASTNVKRRKKLEEMRQMIGADHTPDRPNKRSTEQTLGSNSIDEHLAGRDESSGIEVKDNLLNSQIENDLSTERQECSSRSDNTQPIHEKASSYNAGSDRIISKSLVSNPHSSLGTDCVVNQLGAVTEHLNQVEISDIQEPDLIQSVKSSSLGRNKSPLTLVENLDDEIVLRAAGTARGGVVRADSPGLLEGKSEDGFTEENSKDFKDMPPPPLVPPRRKKKATSVGSLDEVSTTTSPEPGAIKPQRPTTSPPNQLSLPSPGMSGCLLTAPSPQVARKTLNINEAAMGNKVVTAAEGENTRAVNDITIAGGDTESIWDNESIMESQISISSSIESPLNTSGNKAVTAENKSHSFPRGQQRPVSEVSLTPTQMAILDDVSVVNLDTGERIPIKVAEEKIPQCMNPLSLHIMRRTKEYLSDSSLNKHQQAEGDVIKEEVGVDNNIKTVKELGKKRKKLKTLFGKAKTKLKSVKDEVFHNTESNSSSEDEDGDRRLIQVKASKSNKGPLDFDLIVPVQYMEAAHTGAVWTMKFSPCGRLLASGGTDNLLKVWVLKDAYAFFDDMRLKYSEEQKKKMSPAVSEDSLDNSSGGYSEASFQSQEEEWFSPFNRKPFCTYKGHTADILDVSWSKNYFILTSSMDKTVRLWHVSRKECLCCFQHIDFVTAIAFHPKDDRYFLSGSLDGKLRLWNIPDRKVELWNEVNGSTKLITATNFCMKGKFAVAGTYDGRCVFYSTEQLKYYTQIHVRSTRGKNSKGRKITGVEPMPGEDKILVTSNDSRVRIYDLRDLTLTCKYKGCANNSSQIKANFSHDGRFIVCGSEDHFVYIWRTQHEFHKFSSARRDRSDYWESIKAHSAVVTVALFAPKPNLVIKNQFEYLDSDDKQSTPEVRGEVLISADYNGTIKCFINKFKPVNA